LANRRDAVETYFDLRQKNEERRLAQLRKARTGGSSVREVSMTTPQGARRAAGPAMENGEIAWPAVLMSDDLAEHRIALERVSGVATGEITAQEQARAAEAAASLLAELKNRVAEVAPQEYVAAKKWLERVAR
jgi:hypothetical protein